MKQSLKHPEPIRITDSNNKQLIIKSNPLYLLNPTLITNEYIEMIKNKFDVFPNINKSNPNYLNYNNISTSELGKTKEIKLIFIILLSI